MKNILGSWLRPRKGFSYLTPHLLMWALILAISFIASPVTAEIAKFEVTAYLNAGPFGGATNELFNLQYSYDNAARPADVRFPNDESKTYRPIPGFFTLGSDRVDFIGQIFIRDNGGTSSYMDDLFFLNARYGPSSSPISLSGEINGVRVHGIRFIAKKMSEPLDMFNSLTLPLSADFFGRAEEVYIEIQTSGNVKKKYEIDTSRGDTITSYPSVTINLLLGNEGLTPIKLSAVELVTVPSSASFGAMTIDPEILTLATALKQKADPSNPTDPSQQPFTDQENAVIEELMAVILQHGLSVDHAKTLLARTIQLLEWGKPDANEMPEVNA